MTTNYRLLSLQRDLMSTAGQIDQLCRGLEGHARFLCHSTHPQDGTAMGEQAHELRGSADGMRKIAVLIQP
ncbi:hypothetical protein IAE35_13560 [Pseudomonas sp. S75]|uniref:hypothetical protein n=1 Tax=unclassified Pseudomonas TaxID=196821 RepID=UPI00190543EB|nr:MULTISPECIES: hypothetical protein [unclassified Pseudomonas]MBJ9976555.1 hypothetical protein [Pseudomonas sp. S30]MBK0154371.1 hypothetical protein [Pseudomonas sp. S75]